MVFMMARAGSSLFTLLLDLRLRTAAELGVRTTAEVFLLMLLEDCVWSPVKVCSLSRMFRLAEPAIEEARLPA